MKETLGHDLFCVGNRWAKPLGEDSQCNRGCQGTYEWGNVRPSFPLLSSFPAMLTKKEEKEMARLEENDKKKR